MSKVDFFQYATGVVAAMLVANIGVTFLNLKLYTEILKERAQQQRHER